MKKWYRYILFAMVIVALVTLPLVIFKNAEFTGTDDKAMTVIQNTDKNYHCWFEGVKLFQSREITSTFFALQAAIGAGILGYYIGFSRGKQINERKK